jgi:hypothetical protein
METASQEPLRLLILVVAKMLRAPNFHTARLLRGGLGWSRSA